MPRQRKAHMCNKATTRTLPVFVLARMCTRNPLRVGGSVSALYVVVVVGFIEALQKLRVMGRHVAKE